MEYFMLIAFRFGEKSMSSSGNLLPLQPFPGEGHVLLPSMAGFGDCLVFLMQA